MSTREGQAASVTLLRREQLRSTSAPTGCGAKLSNGRTEASAPTDTSEVRRKIRLLLGEGLPFCEKWLDNRLKSDYNDSHWSEIGRSEGAYGTGCKADAAGIQQGDEAARRPLSVRGEAVRHFGVRVLNPIHAAGRGTAVHAGGDLRVFDRAEADGPLRAEKLEAEGYLARTSSADLRSKHVALTEKGEQFARTWIDRVPEAETAALGAMPEEECAAFVRGLHLFCRLLEEGFRENGAI